MTNFRKIIVSAIASSFIFFEILSPSSPIMGHRARSCSLLESFVSKNYFFLFWLARLISFWGTLVWLGVRLLSSLQTNDFFLFQSHHPCKFNTQSAWSSFSFLEDKMLKKSLYSAPVINLAHVSYTFFRHVKLMSRFCGINSMQNFSAGELVCTKATEDTSRSTFLGHNLSINRNNNSLVGHNF